MAKETTVVLGKADVAKMSEDERKDAMAIARVARGRKARDENAYELSAAEKVARDTLRSIVKLAKLGVESVQNGDCRNTELLRDLGNRIASQAQSLR